jgi:hypothetical protein
MDLITSLFPPPLVGGGEGEGELHHFTTPTLTLPHKETSAKVSIPVILRNHSHRRISKK